jgi:UDP-3-O-[3-hydroxymyristoyl] glucosamine N-acyltransferase
MKKNQRKTARLSWASANIDPNESVDRARVNIYCLLELHVSIAAHVSIGRSLSVEAHGALSGFTSLYIGLSYL